MEKNLEKKIEELSSEPITLSRSKKAFDKKSRPAKLARILSNISFTDVDKSEKEEMVKKRALSKDIFQSP